MPSSTAWAASRPRRRSTTFTRPQSSATSPQKFGPENALSTLKVDTTLAILTVEQWLNHHIEHLTGVDPNTLGKYRSYIRNDIVEPLGALPLSALTRDHVARWIQGMQVPNEDGWVPSAKTITNKHGFLAGAQRRRHRRSHTGQPMHRHGHASRRRSPRDGVPDPRAVPHLPSHVTEYWQPMVEFLVASSARWGEVAALRPSDIDRDKGTVRISRSWKQDHHAGGYRLGATKTRKANRTINVAKSTLDKLDNSHEFLFTNRAGGPVRAQGFSARVWAPALERARPSIGERGEPVKNVSKLLRPRIHDLRHTNASWLIQGNVALPVVQQHLGHESITTTVNTYGRLDRRSMPAAAGVIGAVLDGVS